MAYNDLYRLKLELEERERDIKKSKFSKFKKEILLNKYLNIIVRVQQLLLKSQ